jgi:hypothetical protein
MVGANLSGDESAVVHEEVPTEEARVKTVRALKKQYVDQHLAIRHHGQLKKQTHSNGGSLKKFATARGRMTCHAIPALHKEHSHQGPGRDNVARGPSKGWPFRKRCNNGIRN